MESFHAPNTPRTRWRRASDKCSGTCWYLQVHLGRACLPPLPPRPRTRAPTPRVALGRIPMTPQFKFIDKAKGKEHVLLLEAGSSARGLWKKLRHKN